LLIVSRDDAMKILTVAQMQWAEKECVRRGVPTSVLMENAGQAVAEEVRRILGGVKKKRILVLVGPGNNGGDGLVSARYLHDWGARVNVYLLGQRPSDDPNLKLVLERGIKCVNGAEEKLAKLDEWLSSASAVVDAIFGTGKSRPLKGIFAQVLDMVSKAKAKRTNLSLIALDLPSGLNADTGAVDPACPFADYTITLGFPKVGLYNLPGAERAGRITVVDIGIQAHLVESVTTELITGDWAKSVLPGRPLVANKGTFGKVLVVAGSINYIGAAYLACSGAMRVGVGLVTLGMAADLQPILASKLTEVTYLPLPESRRGIISAEAAKLIHRELVNYDVLLMGCGLGQSRSATGLVVATLLRLKLNVPMVLDADALNILAEVPQWWQRLAGDAILTPHPGEMAKLTAITVDEVQSDRIGIAKKMAKEWGKIVVLKGAYTVIAAPDGQVRVSPFANPGLASAGTGDVLTGAIAGLVAQGMTLFDAAAYGVYLHGKAGEMVKSRLGDAGMIASDLLTELPIVIKKLKEEISQ
jgi:NAD(P)H-hydrate epimerase